MLNSPARRKIFLSNPHELIWKRQSKIHDCLNVRLKLYVLLLWVGIHVRYMNTSCIQSATRRLHFKWCLHTKFRSRVYGVKKKTVKHENCLRYFNHRHCCTIMYSPGIHILEQALWSLCTNVAIWRNSWVKLKVNNNLWSNGKRRPAEGKSDFRTCLT